MSAKITLSKLKVANSDKGVEYANGFATKMEIVTKNGEVKNLTNLPFSAFDPEFLSTLKQAMAAHGEVTKENQLVLENVADFNIDKGRDFDGKAGRLEIVAGKRNLIERDLKITKANFYTENFASMWGHMVSDGKPIWNEVHVYGAEDVAKLKAAVQNQGDFNKDAPLVLTGLKFTLETSKDREGKVEKYESGAVKKHLVVREGLDAVTVTKTAAPAAAAPAAEEPAAPAAAEEAAAPGM